MYSNKLKQTNIKMQSLKDTQKQNDTYPQPKEADAKEADPKEEAIDEEYTGPPPLTAAAPIVMQLAIPHMPDTTQENKEYNRYLDYIIEERTRLAIKNK